MELVWAGKTSPTFPPSDPPVYRVAEFYRGASKESVSHKDDAENPEKSLVKPTGCEPDYGVANRIYTGENLAVLGGLHAEFAGKIDCVYIDPPFNSQADYSQKIFLHGRARKSITLKQYGDRWDDADYLQNMFERLTALREMLAKTGSIFVHCDWHAAPALRLVCDEVFGAGNLLNEIVWVYGSGGGSRRRFGRKHDTILFYARDSRHHYFDPDAVRVPYRATIAAKRRDLFNPAGMVAPDVWEISRPPNHSSSWVGYPTQKPLAVVERALKAACPPGGLVLDCFSGSGSTLVAAAGLEMRFIGVEENPLGIHLTRKRLVSGGVPFGVWREEPMGKGLAASSAETLKHDPIVSGEMIDWVAVDPDYFKRGDGVFAPTSFEIPQREDLAAIPPAGRGLAMITEVTGTDHFVRLEP